jgi:hypothetical protein
MGRRRTNKLKKVIIIFIFQNFILNFLETLQKNQSRGKINQNFLSYKKMGGSAGIDRDVISSDSNTGGSSSSNQVFQQNTSLHKSCDPKQQFSDDEKMVSEHKSPIVLCLDVSGSMSEWPKIM